MTRKLSNSAVRQALLSHGTMGVALGAIIYLICLTGTIAVLKHDIERWQQPDVEESLEYSPQKISRAVDQYLSGNETTADSFYVVLPTEALPRMQVSERDKAWYIKQDGSLGAAPLGGWLDFLLDMHTQLHLGKPVGILIVSSFGALLLGILISGIIAHPKILREAFRLRTAGSARLEQVDRHNRLSVLGLPFHILIAMSGAFFGLVSFIAIFATSDLYKSNQKALLNGAYGIEAMVQNPRIETPNVEAALEHLTYYEPTATPIFLAFHQLGQEQPFFEIVATRPGHLGYTERYQYHTQGTFINHQALSDAPWSNQLADSLYRLHFGQFGGLFVKLGFLMLGMALTIVSVTGINIWFLRSQNISWLAHSWCGFVWGAPLGLCIAANMFLIFNDTSLLDFFIGIIAAISLSFFFQDIDKSKVWLKRILALHLLVIVGLHVLRYSDFAALAPNLAINLSLVFIACLLWPARKSSREEETANIADAAR
ncbi:MAG: PepSY domain-containing protein [Pseudomonadales bacterium]|nr:PepSY domain-containing protein [Pseudomonadales bacterium]